MVQAPAGARRVTRVRRVPRALVALATVALLLNVFVFVAPVAAATGTYRNPLPIDSPVGLVESCADPTVEYDPASSLWFMACTTDPLNDQDTTGADLNFHLIPLFSSPDLVHWTYVADAFASRPSWVAPTAGMWAPDFVYAPEAPTSQRWRLYYAASDTSLPGGGSAIGVATAGSPAGPWTDAGTPVVEPHAADCCAGSRRWVFDPEVVRTDGADYIYYGSYFGGISARTLSEDGLSSDPATQVQITIANKYEGAEIVHHGDWYYLFASATNCCNGPLTGYSVFVGRSANPLGPYEDRDGHSLLEGRTGGTPVLSMSDGSFVGPGHNTVFEDFDGQWWTIYHAVDAHDPYFAGHVGFTKRPAMLDPVDWVDGWPTVNGGSYISDTTQQAPAAQPGDQTNYQTKLASPDRLGASIWSDEFDGSALSGAWTWVRPPDAATYTVSGGELAWDTQSADLYVDSNNASVLTRAAPTGPYVVETKIRMNVPPEGCCFNYVQGGLVIYGNDDDFLKLADVSIWETRQTEWAKEVAPVPAGYPRYGNSVVGPPGEWTWLRIVVRPRTDGPDEFRAWTSPDGAHWDRGGTWTHELGPDARIGLVSMGGSGFVSQFDYVRVYRLR